MVGIQTFRQLALSFPRTLEQPHFEKSSLRVRKKIFATPSGADKRAVVKLLEIDQSVFCAFDSTIIYPVNRVWGKQGWTTIDLKKLKNILKEVLTASYRGVA